MKLTARRAYLSPIVSGLASTIALSLSPAACGGGEEAAPGDGTSDAAVDTFETGTPIPRRDVGVDTGPEVDRGTPSDVYPAFPTATGLLHFGGGYVMKSPVINTVTYAGDRNADKFEAFGDQLGASEYWRAITAEYGVGPATSGPDHHVRLTAAAPSETSASEVEKLVQSKLVDLVGSGWPAPTVDSIYVVYLPAGTKLKLFGGSTACSQGVGGYHSTTAVAGIPVPYSVIPYCARPGTSEADAMVSTASHELGEAATDPQVRSRSGWRGFDDPFMVWEVWNDFQNENGDACEFYRDSFIVGPTEFPFAVQRQWSNAAAKAGKDPCVPAQEDAYFSVVPVPLEDVTADMTFYGGTKGFKTKGIHVDVGATRDIELGFFSSAPTADWTLDVVPGNPLLSRYEDPAVSASFPYGNKGKNGNKTILRLSVDAPPTTFKGGYILTITSTGAGGTEHYFPLLVTSN
ncbi:MAG: hypothetical protein ABI175_21455 [Polyangiales bacterium]